MKRFFFVFAMLGLWACTRAQETPRARPDTRPDLKPAAIVPAPSGSVAPPEDPPPPDPVDAKAWTDPAAIAELEKDCHWAPTEQKADPGAEAKNPLSCALDFEQSCVPDPCFDEDQSKCKPACLGGCNECAGTCASGCEACKTGCKDAACRHACATQCGACRQECVEKMDQCTSGTCGKAYKGCREKLVAEWKRSGCTAACPKMRQCGNACMEGTDTEGCMTACKQRSRGKCPEKFFWMCFMGADPTIVY